MTEILKLGRLLKTDKDGYIVSESSISKLVSPWKEAVGEIKDIYQTHLGDDLHSVYVRGTVSRGEAIEGISDIDTFAVVKKVPEEIDRSWVKKVRKELEMKYNFSTGVEIDFISIDELFDGDEMFSDRFMIKTQSACVFGEDLSHKIEPFKADKQTARHFNKNISAVFENARKGLRGNTDVKDIKEWTLWVMKRIIRAGFVLVMDREKAFTRDLYPAYEVFSKYYPEQESKMRQALEYAINPPEDPRVVIAFIDDFGCWIEKEIRTYLRSARDASVW
jgi:hypothetical protein